MCYGVLKLTNRIKEWRKRQGLTQSELALMVGTNQQSIQRFESGNQAPRFDLAMALCEALKVPVHDVFPDAKGAAQNFKRLHSASSWADSEKAKKALEEAGFEMDPQIWYLTLYFDRYSFDLEVSGRERSRLWDVLQTSDDDSFVVTDTETTRFAFSRSEIQLWQFTFEPPYPADDDVSPASVEQVNSVRIWLKSRDEPLVFPVEEDEVEGGDDGELGQMSHIFCLLEIAGRDQLGPLKFNDMDDEPVFFNANQLVAISCPLSVVDPPEYDE